MPGECRRSQRALRKLQARWRRAAVVVLANHNVHASAAEIGNKTGRENEKEREREVLQTSARCAYKNNKYNDSSGYYIDHNFELQ